VPIALEHRRNFLHQSDPSFISGLLLAPHSIRRGAFARMRSAASVMIRSSDRGMQIAGATAPERVELGARPVEYVALGAVGFGAARPGFLLGLEAEMAVFRGVDLGAHRSFGFGLALVGLAFDGLQVALAVFAAEPQRRDVVELGLDLRTERIAAQRAK